MRCRVLSVVWFVVSSATVRAVLAPITMAAAIVVAATLACPASANAAVVVDQVVSVDGSGTVTTPAFSTVSPGDLVVAFAASDGPTAGGQQITVAGAGLTWSLVRRANARLGTS